MKVFLRIVFFFLIVSPLSAQPARNATAEEAAYLNKVNTALLNSLPKEFHGWTVNFPSYKMADPAETRVSNCGYGKDCFWNMHFHIVYDGTTVQGPDYDKLRDSMRVTPLDWHYVALVGRYNMTHQLIVDIGTNETSLIGDYRYCGPNGFKSLPPPAGFDHYYFGSISHCFPEDAQRDFPDWNLFTMLAPANITDQGNSGATKGVIAFKLNPALSSPYKIQNLVIRIYGSRELAKEYMQNVNIAQLKQILR